MYIHASIVKLVLDGTVKAALAAALMYCVDPLNDPAYEDVETLLNGK